MSPKQRVLVIGEALATFMHYPTDPPLRFEGPILSGAPVIFASAAARLGVDVVLGTAVGADMFGDLFRERLGRDGVSSAGVIVDAERPTSAAFLSYEADGSRHYVFYLDGTASLGVGPDVLDRAGAIDWVHVSGATLSFGGTTADTTWLAVERAMASGARISFDPNVRSAGLAPETARRVARLLEVADVVLASAGELEAIEGSEARILARGGAVCYKAGAAGATVLFGDDRWSVPAPTAHEVDPDGAGDIFAAGYVAATLAGADPRASAVVGVRVASKSVEVRGPLESPIEPVDRYLEGAR